MSQTELTIEVVVKKTHTVKYDPELYGQTVDEFIADHTMPLSENMAENILLDIVESADLDDIKIQSVTVTRNETTA